MIILILYLPLFESYFSPTSLWWWYSWRWLLQWQWRLLWGELPGLLFDSSRNNCFRLQFTFFFPLASLAVASCTLLRCLPVWLSLPLKTLTKSSYWLLSLLVLNTRVNSHVLSRLINEYSANKRYPLSHVQKTDYTLDEFLLSPFLDREYGGSDQRCLTMRWYSSLWLLRDRRLWVIFIQPMLQPRKLRIGASREMQGR